MAHFGLLSHPPTATGRPTCYPPTAAFRYSGWVIVLIYPDACPAEPAAALWAGEAGGRSDRGIVGMACLDRCLIDK